MENLSISRTFHQAWALTKRHWVILVLFFFLITIIGQLGRTLTNPVSPTVLTSTLQSAIQDPQNAQQIFNDALPQIVSEGNSQSLGLAYFITLLFSIISGVLSVIYIRCYLSATDCRNPELDDFKVPFITYLKAFGLNIMIGLCVGVGMLLCIIPGIIVALKLSFAKIELANDPNISIGQAISKSWNMTKGKVGHLFLLYLVIALICFVGLLCCCVGYLYAIVVCNFMLVLTYRQISGTGKFYSNQEEGIIENNN